MICSIILDVSRKNGDADMPPREDGTLVLKRTNVDRYSMEVKFGEEAYAFTLSRNDLSDLNRTFKLLDFDPSIIGYGAGMMIDCLAIQCGVVFQHEETGLCFEVSD